MCGPPQDPVPPHECAVPHSRPLTLPAAALLPAGVLHEYAGQMAVFADVNRKLGKSMERMIEWVEDVDFEAATAAAEQGMASIREGGWLARGACV